MGKTIGVVLALKDKCSPQLKKIADTMGVTEKEAKRLQSRAQKLGKELGGNIKKAGMVCTAVVGAVGLAMQQLAFNTMEAGDRIDKMSQKIGMGRKAFQEWDFIMSQNGSNVEVLQMGYKALGNQMEMVRKGSKDSIRYFKTLGVAVKDNKGQFRSQDAVFNDCIKRLQQMKNPTEKAIIANKLFGKSAIELKPLLNQSSDSVDELRERANKYGMVLSDEAIDASVKLKDTLDAMQRSFSGFGMSIGAELLPMIQDFADTVIQNMPEIKKAVTPILEGILKGLKFLSEHTEAVIFVVTAVTSAFGAFKTIMGAISLIKFVKEIIDLSKAFGFLNVVLEMNPIGLVAIGIGLLIGGVVLAYQKLEGFRNIVQGVWAIMKLLATNFVYSAKLVWNFIAPVIKFGVIIASWVTPIGLVINVVVRLCKWINNLAQLAGGWRQIGTNIKSVADSARERTQEKQDVKHNALGTSFSSGGPTVVGEYGPELRNLDKGDSIIPAKKTAQILQGGSKKIELHFHIAGNVVGVDSLVQKIKDALAMEFKTVLETA